MHTTKVSCPRNQPTSEAIIRTQLASWVSNVENQWFANA